MDVHDCKECGCCSSRDPMYSSGSPSRRGWPSGNPLFPPLLKLWDHTWETWGHDEPTLLGHQGVSCSFSAVPTVTRQALHYREALAALETSVLSFNYWCLLIEWMTMGLWLLCLSLSGSWHRLGGDLMPPSCPIVNIDHSPRYGL